MGDPKGRWAELVAAIGQLGVAAYFLADYVGDREHLAIVIILTVLLAGSAIGLLSVSQARCPSRSPSTGSSSGCSGWGLPVGGPLAPYCSPQRSRSRE